MNIHDFLRMLSWFFFGVGSQSLFFSMGHMWVTTIILSPILMFITVRADYEIWRFLYKKR